MGKIALEKAMKVVKDAKELKLVKVVITSRYW